MKPDLLRRIFAPSVFQDDYSGAVAKFLNAILVTLITVVSLLFFYRLIAGESLADIPEQFLLGIIAINAGLWFAARRGFVFQSSIALIVLMWAAMTYLAWIVDGIYDVALVAYLIIIIMTSVLTNWRVAVVVTVLSILSVWGMAIYHINSVAPPHVDTPAGIARDLTFIYVLAGIMISFLVVTLRDAMEKTRREFSERIRMETALHERDERFRKIFHLSPAAISVTSLKDGRLLEANDAYWKLTGLDPETSIGHTTVHLKIWDNEEGRLKFVKKLTERKSLHNPSYEFVSGSGERHITIASYELIDHSDEPSILSMFYDVTQQQTIQAALQANEEKYRTFVEESIEGVLLLTFDPPISIDLPAEEQVGLIFKSGYVAECNNSFVRMYGYDSSTQLAGMHLLDTEPGKTNAYINYQAMLKFVKEGYRSANLEASGITRNGEVIHFLRNSVGMIRDNYLVGLWGTQLDVTPLKKAEEALRRSDARTQALLDAIPDMIFELRRDGTILRFIPSTTNEPLFPPQEFLGKTIAQVLPALADQTAFAITRALESGQLSAFEYKLHVKGEVRTFEARITPAGPDLVVAMVRDVTLRTWAESERESLIDELESKNAELERFTYTVSHDLKSPLITIRGFLGFIREDIERGNVQRLETDIQRVSDATDKMQNLLNDLLELSRIGRLTNQPESIQMNALVNDVVELLHGRIYAGNITVKVDENLPDVFGDRQRIFEVFQNLIDNAAKFMGNQPNPSIEIGQDGERNGDPVFFVQDNGIGFDEMYMEKIFGLFNKLDSQTDGTGIGLALVKRIIEFHGGQIWAKSEPTKGATFFFTLPGQPKPAG